MLQLVLGRAGSGKTEYVFSSIKTLVENGEKNILLITPEQFSFIAERRLLTDLGERNVKLVENTSFTRLADSVNQQFGGEELPVLSKGAKAILMKKAIETVQDSLILFKRNISSVSFVDSAVKIYDEMKSCRVSADDIFNAATEADKEILKAKLHDIGLIIGAYDALIKDEYLDGANELTRLYERLLKLTYFKDRIVFIDGFSGFAAQEYKVLEVILKQAKKVYITFCSDSFNNQDKFNLFSYINMNIGILKGVAEKIGVRLENTIFLENNYRHKSEDLSALEKNLYQVVKNNTVNATDNIEIYSAKNIFDECDRTALGISKLLRKGYKASEIAVIVRDLDKYEKQLSYSFSKFNIPYFDDERQSVNSEPLIMFVGFLLRTIIYSYKSDDIFSLLKTGLTDLPDDDISELENYVYLWIINGSKWKKEFTESTKGFVEKISENDKKKIEKLNASREYVIAKLQKFQRKCKGASSAEIAKAVYFALLDFKADENLKEIALALEKNGKSALAKEQGRIWDLLMNILDELAILSDNKPVSVKEFYKLYSLMVLNVDLGVVPMGIDNVQLGSADRIRCDNPRAVFVLGANEGEFPKSVVSSGLLSEKDRIALIENNFKLYSYGETLNAQEKYYAYMAVCSAKEKVYISYISSASASGESSIIREIMDIFPNTIIEQPSDELTVDVIESDANAFELLASNYDKSDEFISSLSEYFKSNEEYALRLNAIEKLNSNEEETLNKEVSTALFGKNMYLSASRIEDYYNCAFRYFCKFGLGTKPRQRAQMDPMQTGTVIHYVLEQIIKSCGEGGIESVEASEIKILVDKYLNEYLNNKMGDSEQFTARFKYQFLRLSKMLVSVVERLKAEFEQSDFTPEAFELTIGNGENGEAVKSKALNLPDGGSIEIKGAIDRVDIYEENSKKYVRVVDYKSGNKKFKLSDILYGLNLQMFIYLFTLAQSNSDYSGISSGVLYMHSSRNLFSLNRNEDIEKQVAKNENSLYKMKGIVLNDEENEIAKHMEHKLEGKFIPAKYSKRADAVSGDIASLAQIGKIASKVDELVVQMGSSLHSGLISHNPINGVNHDKTCEFCDYSDVCANKKEVSFREMEELNNNEVFKIIDGESEYGS